MRSSIAALTVALLLVGVPAAADPRSDFFLRMLQDPDPRVRLSAALRLGEVHTADSVPGILAALGRETHAPTRAALIAALGAIGDSRAVPALEGLRGGTSGMVRTQIDRTLAQLRGAGGVEPAAVAAHRSNIAVGAFTCAAHPRAIALREGAREALTAALGARPDVAMLTAQSPRTQRGYVLDGNVRNVAESPSAVRITVSLVAQTWPGREYRFDLAASSTASFRDPSGLPEAELSALRAAVRTAADDAVAQIAQNP